MRAFALALIIASLLSIVPAVAADESCFPESGHCIDGDFRAYWEQNGGLAIFGYPLTSAREELNLDTGQIYQTQWFERARFEQHPENAAPYRVLLGRLGADWLTYRTQKPNQREAGPQAGCLWFETTGHNVCNQEAGRGFKDYWKSHGLTDPSMTADDRSLALFGLPLTKLDMETNANGDRVLTQWFERARFEWHPNQPAEHRVMLGLLGSEMLSELNHPTTPDLTAVGGGLFFQFGDGSHGLELWASDGSAAGMRLVKDICLGACAAHPSELIGLGDQVFFMANDGIHGYELWRSDGTEAGTVLVRDICPGACNAGPWHPAVFDQRLYFVGDDGAHGRELWQSDGTAEGTTLVRDINPGAQDSTPSRIALAGGRLYFIAYDGGQPGLWRSDGSTDGTALITEVPSIGDWITEAGGLIFFRSDDKAHGMELWRSDGTAAGTFMVQDMYPGSSSAAPWQLVELNQQVLFRAEDAAHGSQLWRSDGTAAGTVIVKEIKRGKGNAPSTLWLTKIGDLVYFSDPKAGDTAGSNALWRSDGTTDGTFDLPIANPYDTLEFNQRLIVSDLQCGFWRSDGASAGTILLHQFDANCTPRQFSLAQLNGSVFLMAEPSAKRLELWRSDGTPDGTMFVQAIDIELR